MAGTQGKGSLPDAQLKLTAYDVTSEPCAVLSCISPVKA